MGFQQYNKVYFDKDSLIQLDKGLQLCYNAVKVTLGGRGRNVTIHHFNHSQNEQRYAIQNTKDGVTVIKSLYTTQPELNIGIDLMKQTCDKTVKEVGDAPQPLYSKILTPNGWVTMGSLKVGDEICGTNGTFQKVLGVFPQGEKEIYELVFSNGQRVKCSEDHLWSVVHNRKKRVYTTKQIIDKKIKIKKDNGNVSYLNYIPTTVVNFKEAEDLPIDPLLVGLLIGDGSLCESGSIELSLAIGQEKILDEVVLPEGITYNVRIDNVKNYARVKFRKILYRDTNMHKYIDKIGLLNKKSTDKFIPKEYLYSDIKSRERLLKGLTLSDGHINKRGLLEYSTISEQLALDVAELIRGLGKHVRIYKKNKVGGYSNKTSAIYVVTELRGFKNGIKLIDIVKTGEFTEMQCIKVSNDDNLYITDDYVVTHNTSSTVLFTYNIFKEVSSMIINNDKNYNIYKVKKGIENALQEVLNKLDELKINVTNKEELFNIAMVSSNGDSIISKIISDIIDEYGVECNITIKRSPTDELKIEKHDGIIVDRGYYTPALLEKAGDKYRELNNCLVFLTDEELSSAHQIKDVLNYVISNNYSLLLVAKDFKGDILSTIMANKEIGKLINVMLVKAPDFDLRSYDKLKDVGIALGSKVISKYEGTSLNEFNKYLNTVDSGKTKESKLKEYLGYTNKAVVYIDKTIISLSNDTKEAIDNRINEIYSIIDKEKEMMTIDKDWVIEGLSKRIANLKGSILNLYVNGNSELEISEKIDRIDDCINSVKCAKIDGFIPGGGLTLYNISKLLNSNFNDDDINAGYNILKSVLTVPIKILIENALGNYNFETDIEPNLKYAVGYNVVTEEFENFYETGIIDAVKVIKTALINSVSTASTLFTTNCVIINSYINEG